MNLDEHERHHDKTRLQGFQPGMTQTELYSHRRWIDAQNFRLKCRKKRGCTIYVAKTKVLICVFVFHIQVYA